MKRAVWLTAGRVQLFQTDGPGSDDRAPGGQSSRQGRLERMPEINKNMLKIKTRTIRISLFLKCLYIQTLPGQLSH